MSLAESAQPRTCRANFKPLFVKMSRLFYRIWNGRFLEFCAKKCMSHFSNLQRELISRICRARIFWKPEHSDLSGARNGGTAIDHQIDEEKMMMRRRKMRMRQTAQENMTPEHMKLRLHCLQLNVNPRKHANVR